VRTYPSTNPYVLPNTPADGTVQRENCGFIAPGQSALNWNIDNVSIASAVNIALCTVPVGKTLLLTDIYMSHDSTVAIRFALTANGVTLWSSPVKGDTAPTEYPGIETQIVVPQGQTLILTMGSNASTHGFVNISAIQQAIGIG